MEVLRKKGKRTLSTSLTLDRAPSALLISPAVVKFREPWRSLLAIEAYLNSTRSQINLLERWDGNGEKLPQVWKRSMWDVAFDGCAGEEE